MTHTNGVAVPRFVFVSLIGALALATLSLVPDARASGAGVVQMSVLDSGGAQTCGIATSGDTWCWGYNDDHQLGDGTAEPRVQPVQVVGLPDAIATAGGQHHTCALVNGGSVKCWGSAFFFGIQGSQSNWFPQDIQGLPSAALQLSSNFYHSCALLQNGEVWCWGIDTGYELGPGCGKQVCGATHVSTLAEPVSAISVGRQFNCVLTTEGIVKCWGENSTGQLGNGTTDDLAVPLRVAAIAEPVAAVSAGWLHACALTVSGRVWCWGIDLSTPWSDFVQGTYTFSATPHEVTDFDGGVAAISAGGLHMCALMNTRGVRCLGDDEFGQLGDGPGVTISGGTNAVDVVGLGARAVAMSAGTGHNCAVLDTGFVQCWGDNEIGEIGDGTNETRWSPTYVLFDADGDGCADGAELQTATGTETTGGQRNPKHPWDFFDPTGDRRHRMDDILAVVDQYYVDEGNLGYNPDTDRTQVGPNAWNLGPPDGLQRVDDILNALKQYFHDCA